MHSHVLCFNIHTHTPWYLYCKPFVYSEGGVLQNVTGVGRALCWALPIWGEKKKAGVGKQKWYQTWYGIPCGQKQDNGEWESALVLINTEHKALRCSLRHFASPPSETGRRTAKHSLSRADNSALQMESMEAPPFQTRPCPWTESMPWTKIVSRLTRPCQPADPWPPPPCTLLIQKKNSKVNDHQLQV